MSKIGLDSFTDRFRRTLSCDDDNYNKPDFRELDLGSPVSPLHIRPATSTASGLTTSSSSSSGSVSGWKIQNTVPKKSDSGGNSHSGELSGSVESSPTSAVTGSFPGSKPGHRRSDSIGGNTHPPFCCGGNSSNSPTVNVLPAGNICPSGKVLKTGMATRNSRTDVLGSGSGHYGHGSIMRGGAAAAAAKSSGGGEIRSPGVASSRGIVAGEPVKNPISNVDSEELKRAGNDQYKRRNFIEALNLYDRAIALSPANASYRCNRAAALMGLKRLTEAVKECDEALRLNPDYTRAHHRLGSLFLSLGQVENARRHICLPGNQTDPKELQKLQTVEKHINKCNELRRIGGWRSALRECVAAITSGADASPLLFAFKAEALLKLGQLDDANTSLSCVPKCETCSTSGFQAKFFGMIFEAYPFFVRAQIEMALGRFENAVKAAEKAGQMDPTNVEVSVLLNAVRSVTRARARGNDLFKAERFTEACLAYGDGLRFDPSNPVLYCNRAACWYKLGQWAKSLDDCNHALHVHPSYTKALLRRAASYTKLERWAEAVKDYEVLRMELRHDKDIAECLLHAQVALKKSCGEVHDIKFGGGQVELVSNLEQFNASVSTFGASVVHFKAASNLHCKQISPLLDTLCSQYPSINFLKVDVEESPAIANAENVRAVPTIKIYKEGKRVKEMVCPRPEFLESSVKHYGC